jgi:hypothetical protein
MMATSRDSLDAVQLNRRGFKTRVRDVVSNIWFCPSLAMRHGNLFEPVARAHYCKMEGEEIFEFGLKVHDRLPWLGASPVGSERYRPPLHRNAFKASQMSPATLSNAFRTLVA